MYEIRRRKSKRTLLPTQEIFNLPHHIGMVGEELAFDDAVRIYTAGESIAAELNVRTVTEIRTPVI